MKPDKAITSPSNPVIKFMASIAMKKYRDEEKLFMVESLRDVSSAAEHGFRLRYLAYDPSTASTAGIERLRSLAPENAEGYTLTKELLGKITHRDNPQNVVGLFEQKLQPLDAITANTWVVLEGIRDPGNLGTIIRTVDAVGAGGVILVGETCDPWSPETIRATMGSFAHVGIARVSLDEFLNWRPRFKGVMTGTHLHTSTDYRDADYAADMLLAMGSEQSGLSDRLKDACDRLVKIPMAGKAESLNLAVSTGVMLYRTCDKRLFLQ